MKTRSRSIVAMPYTLEIGDIPVFLQHGGTARISTGWSSTSSTCSTRTANGTTAVLSIALHPFLIGHPFRAKHLERALAHIRKRDAVWFTTGSALVDWYNSVATA